MSKKRTVLILNKFLLSKSERVHGGEETVITISSQSEKLMRSNMKPYK